MATALAVYATNTSLGGNAVAVAKGFTVNSVGTGASTYSVGANGAAFGVPNNTTLTVFDLLKKADARASNGEAYASQTSLRSGANTVFSGINQDGDIV